MTYNKRLFNTKMHSINHKQLPRHITWLHAISKLKHITPSIFAVSRYHSATKPSLTPFTKFISINPTEIDTHKLQEQSSPPQKRALSLNCVG